MSQIIPFAPRVPLEKKNRKVLAKQPLTKDENEKKGDHPLIRKDPAKAARYAQAKQTVVPKVIYFKDPRTKQAVSGVQKNLERRRKRGVVKHDWGLTDREQRLQRRVQVLEKRLTSRHGRRARGSRRRNTEKSSFGSVDTGSVEMNEEAPGESWWGGALDTALQLAPHVLPLVAGLGDYEIEDLTNQVIPNANSIAACFSEGEMCCEVPAMHSVGNKVRLTHREYIGDVYSSTSAFAATTFAINAGMNEAFPWGSRTSLNFEKYELLGAMMCFESEGSEYTNSVGLGYVALGSQYDAIAPPFLSKKEMFQSQFSVARKPSKTFAHWIECDPSVVGPTLKYVRGGPNPPTSDRNMYDHCQTTVAVGGHSASGVIIGELWITYDLLLTLPRTDESINNAALYFRMDGSGVNASNPTGSAWTYSALNTITPSSVSNVAVFFGTLPAGRYELLVAWTGVANATNYIMPTLTFPAGFQPVGREVMGFNANFVTVLNSPGFGQRYQVTCDGVGAQYLQWAVAQWVGPTTAAFSMTLYQTPYFAPSTPTLDFRGRENKERYRAMMLTILGPSSEKNEAKAVVLRATSDHELYESSSGAAVKCCTTGLSVVVDVKTIQALQTVSDDMFDLLCTNLLCHHSELVSSG